MPASQAKSCSHAAAMVKSSPKDQVLIHACLIASKCIRLFVAPWLVLGCVYCVLTTESASTVMCSFVSRAPTLSSGNSALNGRVSKAINTLHGAVCAVREALDESELVRDLAALVLDLLLGLFELLGGGSGLEGDLEDDSVRDGLLESGGSLTLTAGMVRMCECVGTAVGWWDGGMVCAATKESTPVCLYRQQGLGAAHARHRWGITRPLAARQPTSLLALSIAAALSIVQPCR